MIYATCFTLQEKNMKYFDRIYSGLCVYSNAHFFFLSRFFKFFIGNALAIVTKCSILDVAMVLNLPQYTPTWIAYTNNHIQVPDEK